MNEILNKRVTRVLSEGNYIYRLFLAALMETENYILRNEFQISFFTEQGTQIFLIQLDLQSEGLRATLQIGVSLQTQAIYVTKDTR